MISNPFKFGKEVTGDQFYDREESFRKLYTRLAGGASNVVMYAPRRYGKTSLVKRVLARFAEEGTPTLYFNLNKVETIEKFCEQYSAALCRLVGKGRETADLLGTYLSHLHPTISLGGEAPVSVRLDYGLGMSSTSLSLVLDMAEKIAAEKLRRPIVVAFDEFQEIQRLSPDLPLEGIFRGCIQEHQTVRYLFFGSKTHMLRRMFGDRERPFYKSATTMKLEKPPEDESADFVKRRFASRSIGIDDDLARRIVRESENIPYYLQQLSSLVFESVIGREGDWVESKDVDEAIGGLLDENADYYSERLSALSAMQRVLLSALSREPVRIFTADYRARHSLGGSSTVNTALKAIVEGGLVESTEKGYFVGDPFFARYVRALPYEAY